jgi:di/tricarboxylate transporter
MPAVEPTFEMWATLALTGLAILLYASERLPVELVSLGMIAALLLLFHITPMVSGAGEPLLGVSEILSGFSSPALIAVSALLVVGQAMISTGALESVARVLFWLSRGSFRRAVAFSLGGVTGLSGFLNNTPVVVIFIPILRLVAERHNRAPSAVMMPLTFAASLGGMLTLIGTSTNLLVWGELLRLGARPLGFFDLTIPGLVLATVGGLYVMALPALLPQRAQPGLVVAEGKQFIAEIDVTEGSPLVGEGSRGGLFPGLPNVTVRLIQRGERTILPPFENVVLEPGDVLIVAATRKVLTEMLGKNPGHLLRTSGIGGGPGMAAAQASEVVLAEAMVRPASRIVGQSLELTNFPARSRCTVIGVQRRARMLRTRLTELRLQPGDVLLMIGRQEDIERLRSDPDVLLMEWSAAEMPIFSRAPLAAAIFAAIVLPAAFDLVPIVITALVGVAALIATGCLNIRQAARAVDRQIVLIIAASLALGVSLEATGGAAYIAGLVLRLMEGAPVAAILSVFFLLVALVTNVLTNNATAVLFTPIAVNLATRLDTDVLPFALAVAFGASCAFATPIGYQTNLLVMGPGQYRFSDFVRAGLPVIFIVWLTFSLFAPWYFGL